MKGAESVTVANGDTTLTPTTHYTFAKTTGRLTIKSAYLATLENGTATLTITDEDSETGTLTVTVTTITVTPTTATFDKAAPAALVFAVTNGEMESLKNGSDTVSADNYTLSEGTLTISADYLATLDNGDITFKAVTGTEEASFVVTVTGTASD